MMYKTKRFAIVIIIFCFQMVFISPFNRAQSKELLSRLKSAREKTALLKVDEAALSVEKKASLLGNHIGALFSFVRDEIQFEPYHFRMKGVHGVLMGKSGNSLEQALLLEALCKYHRIRCQLVRGELSELRAVSLIKSMFTGNIPGDVIADLNRKIIAEPAKDQELLNITREHYWVQHYDKTKDRWIDLDPCFKEAKQGEQFCEPRETFVQPPVRLSPELTITVHLEETRGGRTVRSEPLRFRERLCKLICEPIHLINFIGRESWNGKPVVTGFQPILITSKKSIRGKVYGKSKKSTGFSGVFDKLGESLEQAGSNKKKAEALGFTREWLEFTLSYPDGKSETWSYEVFNHTDLSECAVVLVNIFLSSVNISDDYLNAELKTFIGSHYDAYSNNESLDLDALYKEKPPANLQEYADGTASAIFAMMNMNRFLAVNHAYYSDRFLERMRRINGVAAYYTSPRMLITSTVAGESGLSLSLDLNRNRIKILAPPGAPQAIQYILHQARGFWECALEEELLERWTGKKSLGSAAILSAALEQKIPFVHFNSDRIDMVDQYSFSDLARMKMKESLKQGNIIIAPERMFTMGDKKTIAWWQFDRETGEPITVSENGRHQVMVNYKTVKKLVISGAVGSALFYFGGVVSGFYIGGAAAIAAEADCMNDPGCRGEDSRKMVCALANKKAMAWCENYALITDMKAKDIWSLIGLWQLFSSEVGCKKGARAVLRVGGCK